MNKARAARILTCAVSVLSLLACGGGTLAIIGGTVSGLGSGLNLTLQDNNATNLTLTSNGSFSFSTGIASGGTYSVTVLTQPTGQTCTVVNGSGTVDSNGDTVNIVAVTCATSSSVGGTVSGLAAGTSVTLRNGSLLLPIATNGTFAFPGTLAAGSTYDVTVATQPVGHICTVSNPSGTVVANVMATVAVTCN
jgi:hypothetical protein